MGERVYQSAARERALNSTSHEQPFSWDLGVREPIDASIGEGHSDLIGLSGDLFVITRDFRVRQDAVNRISGEDLFKLHWQTSGHSLSRFSNSAEVELKGAALAYLSQPAEIDEEERFLEGSRETSLTISVTRELLVERLDIDPGDSPEVVRGFLDGDRPPFACRSIALPPRLRGTLQEILQPPPLGSLYKTYLQSRVYEMLWLTLTHLRSLEAPSTRRINLTARDRDCVNEARLLLEQNLQHRPSITELCRRVGINRNKMRYGFQTLFGTSPADYAAAARLNLARRLLRNTSKPIAVIAAEVGYQQQSTFSSAFRRHFGIAPKNERK